MQIIVGIEGAFAFRQLLALGGDELLPQLLRRRLLAIPAFALLAIPGGGSGIELCPLWRQGRRIVFQQ
jgi:hypothetical protein